MRIAFVAPFGLRAKGTARARALPLARAVARGGHAAALFVPPYDSPEDSGLCWRDADVLVANVALPGRIGGTGRQDESGRGEIYPGAKAPGSGSEAGLGRLDQASAVGGADRPAGVERSNNDPAGTLLAGLWQLLLARRLLAAVSAWRPDVVHIFKPKGPSGLVGTALWLAYAGRTGGRRRPALVVDSDDWEGPGGWNDDPRAGYSAAQRRVFAWQERHGLTHAGAWTVTSACLAERAAGFGADPQHVFLLPNGIDPAAMADRKGEGAGEPAGVSAATGPSPAPPGDDESPPEAGSQKVLLYTRFAGVSVADVADIWGRVVVLAPEASLTVAGRGLGGEERILAQQAPNVQVAGWLEPKQMPAFFAGHAAAMVPWADTPPNRARSSAKVLEQMAAGLPIVACTVGELPATLDDAAVLVPPGDAAAFARALVGLLVEPERGRRLGAAARARVRVEYSWDRLAEVALAAYRLALENRA